MPRLSLRHLVAIGAALLCLILGAAAVLVYQNVGIMRDQISADFNQQQLILARQATAQIRAHLDDILGEFASLRRHVPGMMAEVRAEAMAAVFERTRTKGLTTLGLFDPATPGSPAACAPGCAPDELARAAEACALSALPQPALGAVWIGADAAGEPMVAGSLCARLPADGARALFATLNVSQLMARAMGSIRSGRTGYAWAIDQDGMFLYHPEQDFIGRNAFAARQERQPYISFSQINRIMKERMLLGEEGTGTYVSGWHRGVEGEITKLIAFTPMSDPALPEGQVWSVAVVAPTAEVAEAVRRIYVRHIAAEAALIAGMFVVGLLGVTSQRRMAQELERRMAQQEQFMASILQNSVDAIIFVDTDDRVKVWNRGAELVFGYRPDEMAGQTFHRLIPPDADADRELRRIRDTIAEQGYVKDYIAPRMTKDGRRITVDISRTPVRSADGETIGSTVIIKDVTDKMQMEQKIYNAEKLASIGILAAGVAHEINNPLAIMLGFTDLLLERFAPGTPEHDDLRIIAENGQHAKKIVEDLLGFARVTEGFEDTVDVAHCVARVVSIVQHTLVTRKIELRQEVPPSLPPVCGDPREFQQVIFNLVNNAVAAMPDTGGRLTIRASVEDGWVHVSVEDTGVGIPDEIRSRIFDPFFTTKQVGQGTGLGLSLCYGIVSKYGGRITFSSVAAQDRPAGPTGTTFTVSMPVCDRPAGERTDGGMERNDA